MSFVHLHNHTHYSLLDGLSRPEQCVKLAKEQGAPAIAITDHGVLYGVIDMYKTAKEEGIKPILGCEMYIAPEGHKKKEVGTVINHLTVLAANNEGYQNLIKLVTIAHLEGFYYKPRVDHDLFREYGKGLIVLSGCVQGEVGQAVIAGDMEKAARIIKQYQEMFGKENYFLEIMDHPRIPGLLQMNQGLIELSGRTGAALVATNDNHYTHRDDHDAHDILLCIQTGKSIHEEQRMKLEGDFYMRDPEDLVKAFAHVPQAISNTLEIAARCNVELEFGRNLLPTFEPPDKKTPKNYLRELCETGMRGRYGDDADAAVSERLEYELGVIDSSDYNTYFLILHDVVAYAKSHGIIVGPGRGSAAGSIVAYVLQITEIDPIRYDLLFERFLNPERISMPDIDIDFDDERRDQVLDYVVQKYGREKVAQIVTFGTMAARAAVRDVGRAMGYPYNEVDRLAKFVPPPVQGRHIPLEVSVKDSAELREIYNAEPRAKALFDNAMKLEGTIRHAGTHACAVVMSDQPLRNLIPLQHTPGKQDGQVTQFSMHPLEDLGLLKMDFLGLRNLTVINKSIQIIRETRGENIDLPKIPMDDAKTFELLARGETSGVFQLESGGMRRYLKELKPSQFEDIIAMVSLYRPGPLNAGMVPQYIDRKHGREKVTYDHPKMEAVLRETYGVTVYQEQLMRISRELAGFSGGEADTLRKAMGKKKRDVLKKMKTAFINGCKKNDVAEKIANKIWADWEGFADYAFNKSHATCYALIAYQTAYLKANYGTEFMAALLTSDMTNTDRVAQQVEECGAMGIKVLPPSVNDSMAHFTVVGGKEIRFGLKAIKGIGDGPIEMIIDARARGGRFTSMEDFARRVAVAALNKKTLESLAYAGAMDELGERKAIVASTDVITQYAKDHQSRGSDGQTDIFGALGPESEEEHFEVLKLRKVAAATQFEKLAFEKDFLGLYVSGHPLQGLPKNLTKDAKTVQQVREEKKGKTITVAGIVTKLKKITTKTGQAMAYMTLEDLTGSIEVVLFPKTYGAYGSVLHEGQIVMVQGKTEARYDVLQILADRLKTISVDAIDQTDITDILPSSTVAAADEYIISVPSSASVELLTNLKSLLQKSHGHRKVVIAIDANEQRIKVPFGVDVTPELESELSSLLAASL